MTASHAMEKTEILSMRNISHLKNHRTRGKVCSPPLTADLSRGEEADPETLGWWENEGSFS